MIPGYDTKRPNKKNYDEFKNKFISNISNNNLKDISLMLYGSYVRGDYIPGRSDIDGVLIFPDNVIINKESLLKCSKALELGLRDTHIPIQISIADLGTSKDGRFNSFGEEFENYFLDEAKILIGPDYRNQIRYLPTKSSILHTATFNLRKSRTGLFKSFYDKENDYTSLIKNFEKGLETAVNSTKQIAYLTDKNLRTNKFSSLKFISQNYPNVNLDSIEIIKKLFQNPSKLDKIYQNFDEMIILWSNSLNTFESLVKEYIENVPK
ncbi:hypothetical protein EOM09_03545 [bacterium]|nr:hypothetical protein [bacterium]